MEQIQNVPLSVRAAEAIRKNIIEGVYAQGQKLTEEECAAALGLSRICVREAFAQLVSEGLLQKQVNRCTTVAVFTPDDITDIYYLRSSIERMCILRCIENSAVPRDGLLASIASMRDNAQSYSGSPMRQLQEDLKYHALLVDASGLRRAAAVWHSIEGQMLTVLFPVISEYIARFDPQSAVAQHELLTDALITGDKSRIDELIEYHILNSMDILTRLVGDRTSE